MKAAWAPRMEGLRIIVRYVSTAGCYEICEETLHATKKGGEISIIREVEAEAEKQLIKWSRTLGCGVHRFEDPCKQKSYLEYLKSKIEKKGRTALTNINSDTTAKDRPRRICKSTSEHST